MENAAMPEKGADSTVPIKVVVVGVLAATAGLMSGLDIGVISGALDFLARDFNASTLAQEWIVSAMMAGAAVGAVGAGWITRHTGRKWSLVFGGGVFIAGSLLCALAWSVPVLIAGRVLMGLAIGVAAFAAPLYLSEVSDQSSRGAMISTYQLMITIGIFLAFLSDTFFSYHGQWRWMFGIIAIPGIVYVIGVLFLPYSLRWLMMRGRRAEALEVLTSLRATPQEARAEIKAIHNQLQARQNGWSLLRANGNFRRSVGLGMLLQVMQQFAGINVVMYYAPRIFQLAGFVGTAQMWCTAMIGLVNVMATFLAISLVDKWGRRPVLYCGFAIMVLSMASLSLLLHGSMVDQASRMACVFMVMVFIVAHAMSAGPIVWVLCSEIQPMQGRDLGIMLSTLTNWIANMIVGASFLSVLAWLGGSATFGMIAALNACFLGLTYLFVPETKGISLEQIERNLMSGKKLRDIGIS
ncbi:sugar porter family MFS transporter [Acetobacter pasteurianus]|uniref:sugar porter family MFS transporter n=1 Tax=Acetobacter TaxID=434 RepID=UPI000676C482|nr:sugar porter family MFS transporter [Acetobacter pasteurianus]AKR47856.1 D-galactose transporter GalP [Acetobacter pasteurianus]